MTEGRLKKSKSSFNPESGQITLSLKVEDPDWEPRMGRDKWDPNSRTFEEVSLFEKMKTFCISVSEIFQKATDFL